MGIVLPGLKLERLHRLILSLLRPIFWLLGIIPLNLAFSLGRWLGRLAYYVDKKHRDIAIKNLTSALGKENVEGIARRVFENLGINMMEFFRLPRLKRNSLDGYVFYNGIENLEKAQKKGRGVILLTAHFGNWELLAAAVALLGYPLNIIVRRLDVPIFNELVESVRKRFSKRVIDKKTSMRGLFELLEAGEVVGVLLDQNVTWQEGVFVDYFGMLACTNKGMALLALKSRAPVIPAFIIREGKGKHRVVFEKEIPLTVTGDRRRDTLVNTAKFTKGIERFVREYPDHWFWVHQRWKSRPENDPFRGKRGAAAIEGEV